MANIVKLSTKRGQELKHKAGHNLGDELRYVYGSWSNDKQDAYDDCKAKCVNTQAHSGFRIISRNSWQFSVAWEGEYIAPDGLIYPATFIETATNSYIVYDNLNGR